jgi:hypothetical protein
MRVLGFYQFAGSELARPKGARRAGHRDVPGNPSLFANKRDGPMCGAFAFIRGVEVLERTLRF